MKREHERIRVTVLLPPEWEDPAAGARERESRARRMSFAATDEPTLDEIARLVGPWFAPKGAAWRRCEARDEARRIAQHGEIVRLELRTSGLLGGKGGFGAGLRDAGKRNRPKDVQIDFSHCRDLTGRRLGPINDSMRLELLRKNESSKSTTSGSTSAPDLWLLDRPSWAINGSETKLKRGVKRDREFGDAHLGNEDSSLRKAIRTDRARDSRIDDATASVTQAIASALQKNDECADSEKTMQSTLSAAVAGEDDGDEVVRVLSGSARVAQRSSTRFVMMSRSAFATIAFPSFVLGEYKGTCLTDGLIQFGIMRDLSGREEMESHLDGVGDVSGSWAVDLARGSCLSQGEETPLSGGACVWKRGDVVSCKRVESSDAESYVEFWLNDRLLCRELVPKHEPLVAAVSLEEGEALDLTFETTPTVVTSEPPASSSASLAPSSDETLNKRETPAELLARLGAEGLKAELKALGLKYGGRPEQRAERLYLAKSMPASDWPADIRIG